MKLHVIARGKIGRSPEAELVDRYAKRIAWPLKLTELPENGGTFPDPLPPSRDVLLDERGDSSRPRSSPRSCSASGATTAFARRAS